MKQFSTHVFHTRLADVYTAAENYDKAHDHYNTALSICPDYEVAVNGLSKLNSFIEGYEED
jgi:tetratricopeptide (TPR) repeat protein